MRRPAILGGPPLVPEGVPFARPLTPPLERVTARLMPSYERGVLSNGPLVHRLEEVVAERLQVRHVVAVASCTSGLVLAIAHLRPAAPVVVPSFTFVATAHAVTWNGVRPLFVDCDPASFQLDVDRLHRRPESVGGIVATHVFGVPAPVERIEEVARSLELPLIFDAAHAMGASCRGRPVGGFGDAEVFSLSPTKPMVAGEGGLVATNSDDLAYGVRMGRNYGDPGDYDARFIGLSARMSELHAALALESLALLDGQLEVRRTLADRYRSGLTVVPGVTPQSVRPGDDPAHTFFGVTVDEDQFGISRDLVASALRREGIDTRSYFSPPVHKQQAYADLPSVDVPVSEHLSARCLCLPLFGNLPPGRVDAVIEALASIVPYAEEIRETVEVSALR